MRCWPAAYYGLEMSLSTVYGNGNDHDYLFLSSSLLTVSVATGMVSFLTQR